MSATTQTLKLTMTEIQIIKYALKAKLREPIGNEGRDQVEQLLQRIWVAQLALHEASF